MPSPKLAFQRSPTGLTLFGPLPDADDFYILWSGPGARLFLAIHPFDRAGTLVPIEHPTANASYSTWKEAAAAAEAFAYAEEGFPR